ncbi:MAG TPA: hypothetical protein VN706_08545 [Gemmatimonadaceae bacterium]|nr:hypothetical protein [Gemmatimonadaceae bacterium]
MKVDPMVLRAAGDAVPASADALTVESKAPLQPVEIDAARGVEVDHDFDVHTAPNPRRLIRRLES